MSIIDILKSEPFVIEVLDIGAALNDRPPYQSLVEAGRAHVIGFEPNVNECRRLNETYGSTHQFFPHFVGSGKSGTFFETNWNLTGSLFEPNAELNENFQNLAEAMTLVARHPTDTIRLDDLTDLPEIDYIKIDIQGGELGVFENALRILPNVLAIQTEVEFVEMYKQQPMFADVDIFLRKNGFQFHTFTGFGTRAFKPMVIDGNLNKGLRQYLWSDAVYFRDWMALDLLPETKLLKMAVIAHEMYRSYDLAYKILLALDKKATTGYAQRYLEQVNEAIRPPSTPRPVA